MKKTYLFLCLVFGLGISVQTIAQTDPGTANLKHQYTFDDGTANDVVGTANGTLMGGATVANKGLVTTSGGYLDLPGETIGVNTYGGLTTDIWFTSAAGVNSGCTMLSYMGNTTGSYGTDYLFSTPAGCSATRTAISCGSTTEPWTVENGIDKLPDDINPKRIDDGKLHHLVTTLDATTLTLYLDGVNIGSTTLTGSNALSALGTQFIYIAKGGYTGDPTWKGVVHKYSIYDKALSGDEVVFLYQKGAEAQAVISTTATQLAFDNGYPAEIISVSSANLASDIIVTAPAGVSVLPTTITKNTPDVSVTVIYDGTSVVDGNIVLTSGSNVVNIAVKSASETQCYTPLYTSTENIIADGRGMNSLANYGGWGTKSIATIFTEPENVYCGAASIKIGNGTSTGSGSLDILGGVSTLLAPNTTYRVKVMIKTIGGTFQLGVDAGPNVEKKIDTNGEWAPLDFYFTTGETVGANMYINNWACTGLAAYVDNYELFIATDPIISATESGLAFDADYTTSSFKVTASNIFEDLAITAPAGITVTPNVLPADSKGADVLVTYDGTTAVNDSISITAGTTVKKVAVKAISTSNTTCFTPLYTDRTNLNSDPYMNALSSFGGWGTRSIISIVDKADSVYCGSHSGMIIGGGSLDVVLTGKLVPNTNYKARAMVKTYGTYKMGVWGHSAGSPDKQDTINTAGLWKEMIFEFSTGAELGATQGAFFNNNASGVHSFIDNWEIYRVDTISAVSNLKEQFRNIYVSNGNIVAEFDLDHSSKVDFAVFTIQGAMVVSNEQKMFVAGRNRYVVNATLPSGMYLVRMIQDGKTRFMKVIK